MKRVFDLRNGVILEIHKINNVLPKVQMKKTGEKTNPKERKCRKVGIKKKKIKKKI